MMQLRIFVPRGGGLGDARLQSRETNLIGVDTWVDVPTVYEDPDDEVIECPADIVRHRAVDRICAVCLGEGQGRRGDIARRMAEFCGLVVSEVDSVEATD